MAHSVPIDLGGASTVRGAPPVPIDLYSTSTSHRAPVPMDLGGIAVVSSMPTWDSVEMTMLMALPEWQRLEEAVTS